MLEKAIEWTGCKALHLVFAGCRFMAKRMHNDADRLVKTGRYEAAGKIRVSAHALDLAVLNAEAQAEPAG